MIDGQTCSVEFFVVDAHPPTQLRTAPRASSRVAATFAPETASVHVTGSHDDWFRVDRVVDAENDDVLFSGVGWIHRSLLGTDLNGNVRPRLYAAPSFRSSRIASPFTSGSGLSPLACAGDWVKVTDGRSTGWVERSAICENPLTTCS